MIDVLLGTALMICLFTDLKYRKIYNKVLIPALTLGFGLNIYQSGFSGLVKSGQGFLLGAALLILPFIFGGIGAGDVKLLALVGAIKGSTFVFYSFLGMGLSGGIIALGILLYQRRLAGVLHNLAHGLALLISTRFQVVSFPGDDTKIMFPYGAAIFLGALGAYFMR